MIDNVDEGNNGTSTLSVAAMVLIFSFTIFETYSLFVLVCIFFLAHTLFLIPLSLPLSCLLFHTLTHLTLTVLPITPLHIQILILLPLTHTKQILPPLKQVITLLPSLIMIWMQMQLKPTTMSLVTRIQPTLQHPPPPPSLQAQERKETLIQVRTRV
jgi:hypothetical protein